jgi:hypothetical protein
VASGDTASARLLLATAEGASAAAAEELELVCRRGNMLQGLCGMLGVNEASGELLSGVDAPLTTLFLFLVCSLRLGD